MTDTMIFTVLPPMCTNHISDHVSRAQSRTLQQYKGTKVAEFITAIGERTQEMENHLCSMEHLDILDACEGQQLDECGSEYNLPRRGWSDDQYRIALKAQIGKTYSQGTIEDVILLWGLLSGAKDIQIVEKEPCAVELFSDSLLIEGLEQFAKDLFKDVLPGGVRIDITYYRVFPFAFEYSPEDPETGGFGDNNDPSVGGNFSTLIV